MLVGNKCDQTERQVLYEEGQAFAEANDLLFCETSARNDFNIQDAFRDLAAMVLKRVTPIALMFTLHSVTYTKPSWQLALTKLSGEKLDICLTDCHPTVEAASIAISQACGVTLQSKAIKIVTTDGVLLNNSDTLPGATADAGSSLRCAMQ